MFDRFQPATLTSRTLPGHRRGSLWTMRKRLRAAELRARHSFWGPISRQCIDVDV